MMIRGAVGRIRARITHNEPRTSTSEETRDYYNSLYQAGGTTFRRFGPEELVRYASGDSSRVLDVGSGLGENAISWAAYDRHEFVVTGIDISERGIELARGHARQQGVEVKFVAADFSGYRTRTRFDLVTCFFVMHCTGSDEEKERFIDKMLGHLLPGGKLVMECYVTIPEDHGEIPVYPESRLRELLSLRGFTIVDYDERRSRVVKNYGFKVGSPLFSEADNHSAFIVAEAPLINARRS